MANEYIFAPTEERICGRNEMTDEYIKKQDAVMTAMDYGGSGNAQDASQDIASALIAIPAADVHPVVHARWDNASRISRKGFEWFKCSNCGMEWSNLTNFCPNCGADMRTSEEPENLTYIPPEERSGVDDD